VLNRAILAISALLALVILAGCGSTHHTVYITTPLNNGVAAYRVDNHTGRLIQIPGSPYQGGLSPTAIVVHPSHKLAYVTNGGGNNVSLFKVTSTFGLIEVMPRTLTHENPSSLAMDPAGKFLFVTNSGSNNVSVFSIDSTTGALTEVAGSPVAVGFNPIFVTLDPSGKFVYVANSAGNTISAFVLDSSGGLTQIPGSPYVLTTNINAQSAGPNWIAIDPAGRFLYVANLLSSNISGFTINGNTGALTLVNGAPFNAGTGPSSLVFDPSSKFLFVTNLTSNNVTVFELDGRGVPTQITGSPYAAGTRPSLIVLDTTNTYLLVGNQGSNNVTTFSLNPSTGQLTSRATSATGSSPTSLFALK
jgi:6-phosphogluconolactonase (cycloisomerase 2 family)